MLEHLEEVLKNLNVELAYQEYQGSAEEYLIFDIYTEEDSEFVEDENLEVIYYITLNYWHKSKSCIKKYREIKKLLKNNSFFFDSIKTLKSERGFLGKNFLFIKGELV